MPLAAVRLDGVAGRRIGADGAGEKAEAGRAVEGKRQQGARAVGRPEREFVVDPVVEKHAVGPHERPRAVDAEGGDGEVEVAAAVAAQVHVERAVLLRTRHQQPSLAAHPDERIGPVEPRDHVGDAVAPEVGRQRHGAVVDCRPARAGASGGGGEDEHGEGARGVGEGKGSGHRVGDEERRQPRLRRRRAGR